jgi:hypothetical protein
MRRGMSVLFALCLPASLAVLAGAHPAAATSVRIAYDYSGTVTGTCTLDVGGCLPGSTTVTALTGLADSCVGGDCGSVPSSATADVSLDYVAHPPNPCKARELAGTLTLTPTDPDFPPDPIIVSLSGRRHGHDAFALSGTVPSATAYPPGPIRIVITTSFPPNPCTPNTGIFAGALVIG